jgi:hypothetical protein
VFHAVPRWWRWRRCAVGADEFDSVDRPATAPAAAPAQCTGDLAATTELPIPWHAAGDSDLVVADLLR